MYESYGCAVYQRCRRWLGERAAADDALQEVFIRVLRLPGAARIEHPLAWLYQIADRYCIDILRQNKRLLQRGAESCETEPAACGTGWAEQVVLSMQLRSLLARCPKRLQEVAILHYVDGMTQLEIAETIDCSRKTVGRRLARFKKLAAELAVPESTSGGEPCRM
jgi:RNA polymerase sigma-70 factor (ECF subfamily)